MPKEILGRDHAFLPRVEILSSEEITRVVRAAASLGVTKVRVTGGSRWCAATWSGWSPWSPPSRGSAIWR
jgi:hypothetical protein